ncbi:MAG: helix-turn-helix transcriptional regulator [Rhizobiales bacterium]|nr:helix-turn-helix transcriptional regulator [Hyphomicrobiales bacterium]
MQVDLTLRGAMRLYGGLAADLAGHVVELNALPELAGKLSEPQDMFSETTDRLRRLELVEQFLLRRLSHQECPRTIAVWQHLAVGYSVEQAAAAVGWSTRHLSNRVKAASGLKPVVAARMMRLHRATALAKTDCPRWAEIAVEAGYSDQAHLIREFRSLAGQTPTAWADRNLPT